MLEYKFSTSQHSQNLFKNNIVPRLAYVQDINEYHQNLSIKHSHSQFLEIIEVFVLFDIFLLQLFWQYHLYPKLYNHVYF